MHCFLKIFISTIIVVISTSLPSFAANHINIGTIGFPGNLDPHINHDYDSWQINHNVYHTLSLYQDDYKSSSDYSGEDAYRRSGGIIKGFESVELNKIRLSLRNDIVFHDGTPMTSNDVVYTIERILSMDASDFKTNLSGVDSVKSHDDFFVDMSTKSNVQDLLDDIKHIFIIKKNSDSNPIGSGPYKIDSHTDDLKNIKLVRSDFYKDHKFDVTSANYIKIDDKDQRLQHLIDGKLDLLEKVESKEITTLKDLKKPDIQFFGRIDKSLFYLELDQLRDESPFIKSKSGKNPFKDIKIREAISLAVDRDYLGEVVLAGSALASNQYMLPNSSKYLGSIKTEPYNHRLALTLMKEAGFPDGFEVTLHTTEGMLDVAQEIATMLGKIKIKVDVVAFPNYSSFAKQRDAFGNSFSLSGWATDSPANYIKNIFSTYNEKDAIGLYNSGRYSNKLIDQINEAITNAKSEPERASLEKQAMMVALQDKAIIPLFHKKRIWASRKPYIFNTHSATSTILPNIEIPNN